MGEMATLFNSEATYKSNVEWLNVFAPVFIFKNTSVLGPMWSCWDFLNFIMYFASLYKS